MRRVDFGELELKKLSIERRGGSRPCSIRIVQESEDRYSLLVHFGGVGIMHHLSRGLDALISTWLCEYFLQTSCPRPRLCLREVAARKSKHSSNGAELACCFSHLKNPHPDFLAQAGQETNRETDKERSFGSHQLLSNDRTELEEALRWQQTHQRYVEEHVQRTGVAIETQGFTVVTSGRKRESLTGNATMHLYPYLEPLRQIEGVVDYLATEVSTSKQKKFSLVTFIDTPGLVDGDMKYPFDVNKSITWLGDTADLIFVFFDPIGQALCKRTLNLVETLNDKHADRIKFYLSKADEAGHESDRQRVMMQIVQELCKRPGLNRTGFDMPTIYIPSMNQKGSRCANQIEEVCKEIEKTINQTIQNTLNSLERDCDQISQLVEDKLRQDSLCGSRNLRARFRGVCYGMVGMILPLLLLATFLISSSHATLNTWLGQSAMVTLDIYLGPLSSAWRTVPKEYTHYIITAILGLALIMLLVAKLSSRTLPTLTRKQKKKLSEICDYVQTTVKSKKQTLYQEYLQQSVAEHDL